MNRYTLRLYKSKECNLSCNYCNVDYSNVNKRLSNDDVKNFILDDRNYYNIDKTNIYLYGGEPTIIYDNDILDFLSKHFYSITMISNFYDSVNIKRIIDVLGNKVKFIVSLNDNQDVINNVNTYKDYVSELHMVLTKYNLYKIKEYTKLAIDLDKMLRITPENSNEEYMFDYNELTNIFTDIYRRKWEYNLLNYHDVRRDSPHKNYDECLKTNIVLSNSGNIYSCEYFSDVYLYDNNAPIGLISEFKLDSYIPQITKCDHCLSKDGAKYNKSRVDEFSEWFSNFTKTFDYRLTPNILVLFLTEDCNLKCEYCFEGDKKNTHKKMSADTIRKYMDFAWKSSSYDNPVNILMFGGEPTLCLDSIKLIRDHYQTIKSKSNHNGAITFTINTNLVNMSNAVLDELVEFANIVKFFDISVSLDGCKQMQDRRLCNSYDKVIDNVKRLREALKLGDPNPLVVGDGITITKSSTMMTCDYDFIYDSVINMIDERFIFDDFTIGYAVDCDNGSNEEFAKNMYKCWKVIHDILNTSSLLDSEIGNMVKKYLNYINYMSYLDNKDVDCGASSYYLTVKTDGSIIPCHSCFGLNNKCDIPTCAVSDDGLIHIKYGTTEYHFYNGFLNEFKRKYLKIVTGVDNEVDCSQCNYSSLCVCVKQMSIVGTSIFKRSVSDCMRTLKQAEIFLEFVKIDHEKELSELQEIEFQKMTSLDQAMQKLCSTQETIMTIASILTGESNSDQNV